MNTQKHTSILPFAIITFIYFIVGFLTTVNEQLQAPLKFTFLAEAGSLKNTFTTLISFFFFLGYLLNGTLGSKWVNAFGYKSTILRGLMFMISGLFMYLCSSWIGYQYPHLAIRFSDAAIPYGFIVFVIGSYLMGTSAAIIQVVVNPYAASYQLRGTQPVQRLNILTAINSIGTTSAPFFVTIIMFSGISIENIEIKQLLLPLAILISVVIIVALITKRLHLPDIANTRAVSGEKLERSIWSFRHFALGVLAIFFYVGTEVAIGANINLHAFELKDSGQPMTFFGKTDIIIGGMDLGIHALLSTLYWGGFLVGRAISSFFSRISARTQLTVTTSLATILVIIAMITQNLWFLVAVGLLHSTMWSCIFSLSIKGLNKYTSKASGVFISAVFGGAVFTLIQGGLADIFGSWRWTWSLSVICELLMLSYALFGSRIREKDIVH
ncbi:MFS transporter [Elizabethkingia meningoseptica]|uniref:MFS transporter n=1 Tax=Elizabethkingia meningoseptica TaxID=238 RepID=UPI000332D729|nr:MFS transporter [Elizabethkingia meningoseptica]AQX04169.1 MFS transporter [Elizabethkingia meningoseptica]AQX46210.1 MFS transporter [Elizabethkingia meningoseptica]EOR30724.1 major facilitator superfamily MFS_1 [Elizabethkingia meningoseptica ATCC 13253 = NBRC 12535]KUY18726.1 MFS transporter [Elizabethkingia meningoseptica]MCL1676998.1 MFS transporter [Elizabethkingia meningoseptica]